MDESRLPESMRRRLAEQRTEPAIDQVQSFLQGHFGDAYSLDEVREEFESTARVTTRGLQRDLDALERLLCTPLLPGEMSRLVAWHANWVLDDPSDEAARVFLEQVAEMVRQVIAAAPPPSYLGANSSEE